MTYIVTQQVLLKLNCTSANVTKIRTWSYHIKKLVIEKCTEAQPVKFDKIVETELSDKVANPSFNHVSKAESGRMLPCPAPYCATRRGGGSQEDGPPSSNAEV